MQTELVDQILQSTDRELWLVTARAGGRAGGLIATCVVPASIVPDMPRVLVGLSKRHHTQELAAAGRAFVLHLLRADQHDLIERFGLQSGRDVDKFDGLDVVAGETGSPRLTAAAAWLECRIEAELDGGDRVFYLAEVVDAGCATPPAPFLMISEFLHDASPETLQTLRDQRAQDAVHDAEAIRRRRKKLA